VVEPGDDDLVAGLERSSNRAREREVERGHVLAEADLGGRGAEKPCRRLAGCSEHLVAPPARLERAAQVRVRLAQVGAHRLDDRIRHLRPAGAVEEGGLPVERRKASADGRDVEGDRAQRTTSPFTRHS
jgi:hypothetical protein